GTRYPAASWVAGDDTALMSIRTKSVLTVPSDRPEQVAVPSTRRSGARRARRPRLAVMPAAAQERGGFAREGVGLTDGAAALAAHQIHVHVVFVVGVGSRRQHGGEHRARAFLDIVQEALFGRRAVPAVLDADRVSVRQR